MQKDSIPDSTNGHHLVEITENKIGKINED